jgi:hypothetical protein
LIILPLLQWSEASFHIQENGDTVYYKSRGVSFETAWDVCTSLKGRLPVIKTSNEKLFYKELISRAEEESLHSLWVDANYSSNGFVWSPDLTPVEAGNVMELSSSQCEGRCCRLELRSKGDINNSFLNPVPCDSSYKSGFVCIIKSNEIRSPKPRARRAYWATSKEMDDKIKKLEGMVINLQVQSQIDIRELKADVKSLKITRYILFSLVTLALVLILLLCIGLFIAYKKARLFIIGKIRDVLSDLGGRVEGMTRKLERSLDK